MRTRNGGCCVSRAQGCVRLIQLCELYARGLTDVCTVVGLVLVSAVVIGTAYRLYIRRWRIWWDDGFAFIGTVSTTESGIMQFARCLTLDSIRRASSYSLLHCSCMCTMVRLQWRSYEDSILTRNAYFSAKFISPNASCWLLYDCHEFLFRYMVGSSYRLTWIVY